MNTRSNRAPLVIFDCDGVLVDSEPIASQCFSEHLQGLGLPYSPDDCRQLFTGLSLASCQRWLETQHPIQLPTDFFQRLQESTFRRFAMDLQPIPGIIDTLDYLDDSGIRYCVASSGDPGKMEFTLGHTGLLSRFSGKLFSATHVARGKPAPDLFLHAADAMSANPTACLVIEDSGPGIQAALAAGMRVVGFQWQGTPAATVQMADMAELPGIIQHLSRQESIKRHDTGILPRR